jgi:hypothetical protein
LFSQDTDPVYAKFADGSQHAIFDFTVLQWRAKQLANQERGKTKQQWMWEGKHIVNGAELHIAARTDRGMLLSLYQDKKQICQIGLKAIDKEEALGIMKVIAEAYAADELKLDDVYAKRDELLKASGSTKKGRIKKRPASASGDTIEPTVSKKPAAKPAAEPAEALSPKS